MPEITKNQLKHIRLLKQKKYRKEYSEFIVEGEKNVEELLKSNFEILSIFASQDWDCDNDSLEVTRINPKQLSQLSNLTTPNKVIAIAKTPLQVYEKKLIKKGITLVLDSINDPGNLGTIIRSADWFGIKNIICSINSVDCFNPKTVMATKGSIFNVTIHYKDLEELFNENESTVYGAFLDGEEISTKFSNESDCLLLMGSESHGISRNLEPFITNKIKIPRNGNAESLNVAMATSILLYQFTTS